MHEPGRNAKRGDQDSDVQILKQQCTRRRLRRSRQLMPPFKIRRRESLLGKQRMGETK
jgi:hypothetical protein